jgi:hypothetical protein
MDQRDLLRETGKRTSRVCRIDLEFREEAKNAFNHPQFVNVPLWDVFNTVAGRFLNRDFTDSGIRSMRPQVKQLS